MPSAPRVRVEGLDALKRNLRKISADYPKELKRIHLHVALPRVRSARSRIRSRSGALAGTVKATATQKAGSIQAGGGKAKEYAAINHYGGYPGRYAGNPFLLNEIAASQNEIARDFATLTDAFIERVWVDS